MINYGVGNINAYVPTISQKRKKEIPTCLIMKQAYSRYEKKKHIQMGNIEFYNLELLSSKWSKTTCSRRSLSVVQIYDIYCTWIMIRKCEPPNILTSYMND